MNKLAAFLLSFLLVFNPLFTFMVLAEESSGAGEESVQAEAEVNQETEVENSNEAEVKDSVNVEVNSGGNQTSDGIDEEESEEEKGGGNANESGDKEENSEEEEGSEDGENGDEEEEVGLKTKENESESESDSDSEENLISEESLGGEESEKESETGIEEEGEEESEEVKAENNEIIDQSEAENEARLEENDKVSNENIAEVENKLEIEGGTGENELETEEKGEITTGTVDFLVFLANILNQNYTGSDFWVAFYNLIDDYDQDIDMTEVENYLEEKGLGRELVVSAKNEEISGGSETEAKSTASLETEVENNNKAEVSNEIKVVADSGNNLLEAKEGEITTGDIAGFINLFNLINTNLTGENWYFSIINLFGNLNGDLIFPYEKFFYENGLSEEEKEAMALNSEVNNSLAKANSSVKDEKEIINENTGKIENEIDIKANTGENQAFGEETKIKTGTIEILNNLGNIINTNITGNNWLLVFVNVFGDWQGEVENFGGEIYSNPFGWMLMAIPFISGDDGSSLFSLAGNNQIDDSYAKAESVLEESTKVNNKNEAEINNKVEAVLNSGVNKARGEDVEIETGKIKMVSNLVNVVNTNIFGRNWFFGIINVFGSWVGNLIFGRPDLWIGISDNMERAGKGEQLTYSLTIGNQGYVGAKDLSVWATIPRYADFVSSCDGGVFDGEKIVWAVDNLEKGRENNYCYTVRVNDLSGLGDYELLALAGVSTQMDEPNLANNSASDLTMVNIGKEAESNEGNNKDNGDNGEGAVSGISDAGGDNEGEVLGAKVGTEERLGSVLGITTLAKTGIELVLLIKIMVLFFLLSSWFLVKEELCAGLKE